VQMRLGATVSEKALQDFAAERLAAFKVPAQVRLSHQALPRNETGKLVKSGLHKVFGA